eukprot:COSAG05_NODE_838_length_7045_cov_19.123956_2_plen_116_part_00
MGLPPPKQLANLLTAATILGTISNLLEASGTTPMNLPVSGFARSLHKTPPTEETRKSIVLMLAAQADALEMTMDGPIGVNSGVAGHNISQYHFRSINIETVFAKILEWLVFVLRF